VIRSISALRKATMACRECPIGEHATQSVIGEGPVRARMMLVGEQPGDQEDLQGRPFVGPAGRLLDAALVAAGVTRAEVFVTNAVKHFKFEPRGKRRIHKSPSQREAMACAHWLEDEIALVKPSVIVALGARAAWSLTGSPVAVTKMRGQWLTRSDGVPVLVTMHPSALLRLREESERSAALNALVRDLVIARGRLQAGGAGRRLP
jgi:uracil-DNA glycosylase